MGGCFQKVSKRHEYRIYLDIDDETFDVYPIVEQGGKCGDTGFAGAWFACTIRKRRSAVSESSSRRGGLLARLRLEFNFRALVVFTAHGQDYSG